MITTTETQTKALAKKFATKLKPGQVICLTGNLGAGKTVWTKGLAKALGIKQTVNSPTFNLVKTYKLPKTKQGIKRLYHIDLYRLEPNTKRQKQELMLSLGLKEILADPEGVTVIEWGDKLTGFLPKQTVYINFEHINNNKRKITY